jgi:hypothetical protein
MVGVLQTALAPEARKEKTLELIAGLEVRAIKVLTAVKVVLAMVGAALLANLCWGTVS